MFFTVSNHEFPPKLTVHINLPFQKVEYELIYKEVLALEVW